MPPVVLLLLAAGLLTLGYADKKAAPLPAGATDSKVGATLPDFPLQLFKGKALKASELQSKVTLINFWATWCEACVTEMPSIAQLRATYKDKGFDVVAIDMDENPDAVLERSLKKFKIDFPVYIDPTNKMAELFDIGAIPLTIVIDRNRKVLHKESGGRDWNDADMRKKLEKWLAAKG